MSTYRATFERIGCKHEVPALDITVGASDSHDGVADVLAEHVYRYARGRVASRDLEVVVDLGEMNGAILCGGRDGGRFTLERLGGAS